MLALVANEVWGFMLETYALCRKVNASYYPLTPSSWMRTFPIHTPFQVLPAGGQVVQMQVNNCCGRFLGFMKVH